MNNSIQINKSNKYQIQYSNKNLFEVIKDRVACENNGATIFVPHICNNVDSFGAGFAVHVADRYSTVKADYHMLGKTFLKNNPGYTQVIKVFEEPKYKYKIFFANMIAQNGIITKNNPRPINYAFLVKSMIGLSSYIQTKSGISENNENVEIHCPKFGSGLAGGNWNFISDLIEDIWLPRYSVTVYEYPPKPKFNK